MKKRGACLLLALVLCTLCACTEVPGDTFSQPPADPPATGAAPLTMDWYLNFSWFTSTWEGLVAEKITELTGVEIRFITPTGNEAEKLNSMIAGNSLPDFVTLGHWEPAITQMISDELVYPLNELADTYDPAFWDAADPQRVAWYTQPDGNLYAYPNSSYTPKDYEENPDIGSQQAFLVRKDIYEAIGSPDMTTPEGFVAAIKAAQEAYPEVNGEPLLPIGLYDFDKDGCYSLEAMLMNLLAVPFEKDGEIYDRYTDPEYLRWLKVFRQLAQEGYLEDDMFVDRRVQMAEKVADGRYFCMIYQHSDIADQQKYLYAENPGSQYIAVDGPKNTNGDPHTLPGVGINGWTVTLISKNCEAPARAIGLMRFMMSEEGQKLLYCGVEGITYDEVDGEPVMRADVLEMLNTNRIEYNKIYAADNTFWMLQDLAMQHPWQPEAGPPLDQPREWTYPYTVYTAQYDAVFPIGSEAASAHERIREAWGRTLPQLLLADSDEAFDEIFSAYLEEREALGFEMMQQEATRQMNQAKEKLNLVD